MNTQPFGLSLSKTTVQQKISTMTGKKVIAWLVGVLIFLVVCGYLIWFFFRPSNEWVSAIGTVVSALFSIASVFAVILVWEQLKQNKHQFELNTAELEQTKNIAQLQFEDSLEKEYRELIAGIPIKALLDSDLSEEEYRESFDEFFRYFDLSNKQAALWKEKRIGKVTWDNWRSGIRFNLSLPAFSKAWGEVKSRTADHADEFFSELRELEESGFSDDWPRSNT